MVNMKLYQLYFYEMISLVNNVTDKIITYFLAYDWLLESYYPVYLSVPKILK